jgi:hypothetical protein
VPLNLRTTLISLVVGGKYTRGWLRLITACRSGCGNEDLGAQTLVWSFAMIIMHAKSARRAKETRINCAFASVDFDLNLCPSMKFYVYKYIYSISLSRNTLHQLMYLIISVNHTHRPSFTKHGLPKQWGASNGQQWSTSRLTVMVALCYFSLQQIV